MTRILTSCFSILLLSLIIVAGCSKSEEAETLQEVKAVALIPSLQEKLDTKAAESADHFPDSILAVFVDAQNQIEASGVIESALKKEQQAPDFKLPNAKGEMIKLSTLLKDGPVVLTWYRGGWCPYCNIQLNAYNEVLDQFKEANGQLVAISPEIPDSSLSTKEKNNLGFEVLSDVGNIVAKEYGVVYTLPSNLVVIFEQFIDLSAYNNDKSNQLPLSITYIIDTDQVIKYAYFDVDYKKRAEPSEVISVLKSL